MDNDDWRFPITSTSDGLRPNFPVLRGAVLNIGRTPFFLPRQITGPIDDDGPGIFFPEALLFFLRFSKPRAFKPFDLGVPFYVVNSFIFMTGIAKRLEIFNSIVTA